MDLGALHITESVKEEMQGNKPLKNFIFDSLLRQQTHDWGDPEEEDRKYNNDCLEENRRVLSRYEFSEDKAIFIFTKWDRSSTAVLFPEEYQS